MSKSLIQDNGIQTVDELITALQQFKTKGTNYININAHSVVSVIGHNVELSISLDEEALTDGSKVHDITLTFHA